jgi:hypothetical protein
MEGRFGLNVNSLFRPALSMHENFVFLQFKIKDAEDRVATVINADVFGDRFSDHAPAKIKGISLAHIFQLQPWFSPTSVHLQGDRRCTTRVENDRVNLAQETNPILIGVLIIKV